MSPEQVLTNLQPIFEKVFISPVQVTMDLSAADVEEWDSLTQISLIVAVEKEFGIRFRVGEVARTQNIREFVDLIIKRLKEK